MNESSSAVQRGFDFHPIADVAPMIEGEEYRHLVDDIKIKGLKEPIVLYEGKILDGRSRYRACLEAGETPTFTEYNGDDPVGHMISLNANRRHLHNIAQRALMAAKISMLKVNVGAARERVRRPWDRPISQKQAAKLMGVNTDTLSCAMAVLKRGTPEEIRDVESNRVAISTAAARIRERVPFINKDGTPRGEVSKKAGGNIARMEKMRLKMEVWNSLKSALDNLGSLPDAGEVADIIYAHHKMRTLADGKIERSLKWLQEFANVWSAKHGQIQD